MTTANVFEKTVRTSKGLRDTLFNEIDLITNGESTPDRARAIASLSSQVLQSVKLEIELHRYVSNNKKNNGNGKNNKLSEDDSLILPSLSL